MKTLLLTTVALGTMLSQAYALDLTCDVPTPAPGDTNPVTNLHITANGFANLSIDYTLADGSHHYREKQYRHGWHTEAVPSSRGEAIMWQGGLTPSVINGQVINRNSNLHVTAFIYPQASPPAYREDHYDGKAFDKREEFVCHQTEVVYDNHNNNTNEQKENDEYQQQLLEQRGNQRQDNEKALGLPDCGDALVVKTMVRNWMHTHGTYNGTLAEMLIPDRSQSMGIDNRTNAKFCITYFRANEQVARDAENGFTGEHPLSQLAYEINQKHQAGNDWSLKYKIGATGEGANWMVWVVD